MPDWDLPAPPPPGVARVLTVYRALLERHHRTLDLLSPKAFADLDRLLDEAARYAACVHDFAPEGNVLDLGTGAGLPGVIVAAHLHPRPMWWVERRQRRATFLEQVAALAGLTGVRVIADDVRRMPRPPGGVRVVTAQAVASFTDVARLTRHLWSESVVLVSRKGPDWPAEVDALAAWWAANDASRPPTGAAPLPRDAAVPSAEAATASDFVAVLRAEPLGTRGTLVAVAVRGG